jgi:hypothetical protein
LRTASPKPAQSLVFGGPRFTKKSAPAACGPSRSAGARSSWRTIYVDPFIDSQDWEISNFDIAVDDGAPGKATATIKFTNFDKPATVRLDLVKAKNDWRIADITWLRDGKADSLRKIYGQWGSGAKMSGRGGIGAGEAPKQTRRSAEVAQGT